jgi:hypothetical protein
MNAARRKSLSSAIDLIEKFKSDFEEVKSIIADEASAEREYYDNMPENMQSGDKGEAASAAADALDDAAGTLGNCDIDEVLSKIDEARGEG